MPDNEKHNADSNENDRPTTLGEHLRLEREAKGLSTQQVAQHLLVDTWIVEALEANNFSALGAPVFAKGHLRKYAAMLGLAPDELMMEYHQAQDKPVQPPLVARYRSLTKNRRIWPWLLAACIVLLGAGLLVVGGGWLTRYEVLPRGGDDLDTGRPQPSPAEGALELELPRALQQEVLMSGPATPDPVAETAEVEPEPEPEPQNEELVKEEQIEDVEPIQIRLTFNRESWAEIYDANRTRLMYGMGRESSVRVMSGVPPVQVFLGFADGVDIEINGRLYEVSAEDRRGNTARFRLEARDVDSGG